MPSISLRRSVRGTAVASLHRHFESLELAVDTLERSGRMFGPATEKLVREVQARAGLAATGVVDDVTRAAIDKLLDDKGPLVVSGRLGDGAGDAIAGALVLAVDVDLRRNEVLGKAVTDRDGEFYIRYSPEQFARAEKESADIVVRALVDDERIAESATVYNAPGELRVELRAAGWRGLSEYERLARELEPLGAAPKDLVDDDVAFLVGETTSSEVAWRSFVQAQRVARELPAPPEACHAWVRGGLPAVGNEIAARPTTELRRALELAIERNLVPAWLRERIDGVLAALPSPAREEVARFLGATVDGELANRVATRVDDIDELGDDHLERLVAAKVIDHPQAARLGLAISMRRLLGPNTDAVTTLLNGGLGDVTEPAHLARLAPSDWERALEQVDIGDGVARATHARRITKSVADAFPEQAYRGRVAIPPELDKAVGWLDRIAERNDRPLTAMPDKLDLAWLPETEREAARNAHHTLRALANAHPGLQLSEALTKHRGGDASAIVRERLGWLASFHAANPDVELLATDLVAGSVERERLAFGDLPPEARSMVIADVQAAQRAVAVTGNVQVAHELRAVGAASATAVYNLGAEGLAAATGMAAGEAASYYRNAQTIVQDAALVWLGIHEAARDEATSPVRVIPQRAQFFRELDAYKKLVADQPWCACEHCHSILGPAAYFVDLMSFVERFISANSFKGREAHPLHLRNRRPDLWNRVQLTCAHANDLVPYLDLVNEVLERYLLDVIRPQLPDATALYAALATEVRSFAQPFVWSLERVTTLLSHFSITRADIAKAIGATAAVIARARLGLSVRAAEMITVPQTDRAFLLTLYGIDSTVTTLDAPLAAVEIELLLAATRLEYATLVAILRSEFVRRDGTTVSAIAITFGKRSETDVQNNTEMVSNLTLRRLDRIHRFARLWKTTPWTVAELDAVVATRAYVIDAATLEHVAASLDAPGFAVDEWLALDGTFVDHALRGEPSPLFDRLFNTAAFVGDGRWPPAPGTRFSHPSWTARRIVGQPLAAVGRATPAGSVVRLRAGLELDDDELVALIDGLGSLAAIDRRPATTLADESIALSRDALLALYRHALVRRAIGCSVADLLGLLSLAPIAVVANEPPAVRTAADARAVIELAGWQKTAGWTLAEMRYLVTPSATDARDPAVIAAAITKEISDESALVFADTVLVELGLTEAQSRAAIAANVATGASQLPFEAVPGGYRIRDAGLAQIVRPAGVAAPAFDALFRRFDPVAVLDTRLGSAIMRTPAEIRALRVLVARTDRSELTRAVWGDTALLRPIIADVLRYELLLGHLDLATAPAHLFGTTTRPSITLDVLRRVAAYAEVARRRDVGFTTEAERPSATALAAVVTDVATATDAQIAAVLRLDVAAVAALRAQISLPTDPFAAIAVIRRCAAIVATLGVSTETLVRIVADSAADLGRAADDVLAAFRARYAGARLAEMIEPYDDILRTRLRDGLVEFLLARPGTPFTTREKISAYFLMDVQMQGCARTSRIVAATGSLRTYVQRTLMNLERSEDGVAAFLEPARRPEWEWRKHYRVWEANRRVFLYPENYLEPELRDDKTPLFKELEQELVAQEIDAVNVGAAFSRYVTGFDQATRLRIAGAHWEAAAGQPDGTGTLHVFGVSDDDAPMYFYRAIRETGAPATTTFSAWQKVNLQIGARAVTPITFLGRLYVFWIETSTRPVSELANNAMVFKGYRHDLRVKFSYLRPDRVWSSPHLVRFVEDGGSADARNIDDPFDQEDQRRADERSARIAFLESMVRDDGEGGADDGVLVVAERVARTARDRARDDADGKRIAREAIERGLLAPFPPNTPLAVALGLNPIGAAALGVAMLLERDAAGTATMRQAQYTTALTSLNESQAELAALRNSPIIKVVRWDQRGRDHTSPIESYRPEGWQWERVYADVVGDALHLTVVPKAGRSPAALATPGELDIASGELRQLATTATPITVDTMSWSTGRLLQQSTTDTAHPGQAHYIAAARLAATTASGDVKATAPAIATAQAVGCAPSQRHVIVQSRGDSAWLRPRQGSYRGVRLGCSLTRTLARQLARADVDGLLDAGFQQSLREVASGISPLDPETATPRNPVDDRTAYATYFDETFVHIPFLIADHLNAQAKYKDAQRWFHHLFDPTAADAEPWRARDLRESAALTQSLREQLTNRKALDAYRADPFNPHAIARTRPNAYHKAIVMKYVDNLLDWGDMLFEQFTMESIDEANLLYTMARDILGPRPRVLGSCGEDATPKTYDDVRSGIGVSDVLVELEVVAHPPGRHTRHARKYAVALSAQPQAQMATYALTAGGAPMSPGVPMTGGGIAAVGAGDHGVGPLALTPRAEVTLWSTSGGTRLTTVGTSGVTPAIGTSTPPPPNPGNIDFVRDEFRDPVGIGGHVLVPGGHLGTKYGINVPDVKYGLDDLPPPAKHVADRVPPVHLEVIEIVPTKPVFCIPPNGDLLAFWDRVDSRLFNIRNCRDIAGVRRRPSLFAPEIDPRLLVRIAAAGLSVDEVLNATSGNLPPYRFSYLVDKAKQHAATVQSFGAQLAAALEKQDGEELGRLRTVHEQHLLVMRRKLAELEIKAANDAVQSLERQREAVEYRRQHYVALRDAGQLRGERTQQSLQAAAAESRAAAGVASVVASVLSIMPDLGAWTAMKYGGTQLGSAGRAVADSLNAVAAFDEMGAQRSGVEASNQRRDQEWMHQVETARLELAQLDRSITAAELRRQIAEGQLEVHERTIRQTEELFELTRDKFSNVERYRLLAKELRRLYRLAFNSALALARMAEQAFRAERPDDEVALIGNYWDPTTNGLLAGERLVVDLQQLERQFIERNYRELEVQHAFSLAQFAPDALASLRLTGTCEFTVPEWFFDLTYPGQYRRRLKSARLTIPCVVGPQTNVGATLRLLDSWIQRTPGSRVAVPSRHTTSIATSRAQNDAGVFEFSFRDERYMPFEGAGAADSRWSIELPKTLRTFDYATITDVVLQLDYTALYDGGLADRWDRTARELLTMLSSPATPQLVHIISLRSDFPDVFHRLMTSTGGTEVAFEIDARRFPTFVQGANRRIIGAAAELAMIATGAMPPGTTVGLRRATAAQFRTVSPSAQPIDGGELRSFGCGSVFVADAISANVLGDYVMTLHTTADRKTIRDITIRIGYAIG